MFINNNNNNNNNLECNGNTILIPLPRTKKEKKARPIASITIHHTSDWVETYSREPLDVIDLFLPWMNGKNTSPVLSLYPLCWCPLITFH
ncbi:hypothetical protein BLOT_005115 [Blomia tropicalis]|nr:hypothetical protein BLOT_005115 [Blomia tropicalis]